MAELPSHLTEWQQQLEMASFIDTRKGDISGGTQFRVYTKPNLDFVVKEPRHETYMRGYRSAQELASDLTIPFTVVENLPLKVNHQKKVLPEAVLQEKAEDLLWHFFNCIKTKDIDILISIISQQAEINQQMLQRGLTAPDPYYGNFGIKRDGRVGYLDLGSLRTTFEDDIEYSGITHARGRSHYATYLMLTSQNLKLNNEEKLEDLYNRFTGLDLGILPEAPTLGELTDLERKWPPSLNLAFAEIGDREIRRFWPLEISQSVDKDFMRTFPKGIIE